MAFTAAAEARILADLDEIASEFAALRVQAKEVLREARGAMKSAAASKRSKAPKKSTRRR
jgi:hypothetical protein